MSSESVRGDSDYLSSGLNVFKVQGICRRASVLEDSLRQMNGFASF